MNDSDELAARSGLSFRLHQCSEPATVQTRNQPQMPLRLVRCGRIRGNNLEPYVESHRTCSFERYCHETGYKATLTGSR